MFNQLTCKTIFRILRVKWNQSGTQLILNLCEYNLITVKLEKILNSF